MTDGPLHPRSVLETALYADDLDAAESFYATVLNLPVIARIPGRHVFFRMDQGVLLIFNPEQTRIPTENTTLPVPPHGASGPGHVCFAATRAQIALWRDRLTDHGVAIEAEFDWPNGARSLYFRDPAGNSLEFAEPHLWDRQ
ncbi:VOC family protein [Thalassovita sp.]|uniref:VOC family protein n=1 Tax=Thalassovita sp. TaxID=1979401 RepID=UPI0029DE6DCA|nr:VOC family protein [Thalassovita sp.]